MGRTVLSNFEEYLPRFWQVVPPSEENTEFTRPGTEGELEVYPEVVAQVPGSARSMAGARSPSQSRSSAVTMKMQAAPQFQVHSSSTPSSTALDQDYWGKKLH